MTAGAGTIAGNQTPKLCYFADHNTGGADIDPDRPELGEDSRQGFRLQPQPARDDRFVIGKLDRAGSF